MLADPALPDTVLADPALPDTVLPDTAPDPVLLAPALPEPVLPEPVLPDPVLSDPVLAPAPAAGGVLSVGLAPVSLEAGVLGGDTGAEELLLAGVDAGGWGLAVLDGWAELGGQEGVPVGLAVWVPPVALPLDFAEAVEVVVLSVVALSVAVAVAVAVVVALALALSAGLLFVLPLGGLLTEFVGDAAGAAELADLAGADDAEPGGHAVACPPLWAAEVPPWLPAPAAPPL